MSTEDLIRVTVCIHRKEGVSEEDFYSYWSKKHGPLVSPWLKRCGVVKYVQYHTPSSSKALISAATASVSSTESADPTPYDPRASSNCSTPDPFAPEISSSYRKNLSSEIPAPAPPARANPVLTYDGMADFYVKSYEDFRDAFLDPEYIGKIRPDEERFIDVGKVFGITVGRDLVIFDETKGNGSEI